MKIIELNNKEEIAKYVSKKVISKVKNNKKAVIGFATGTSPLLTYKEIIKDHQKNHTSWKDITTFNLDEYISLPKDHKQSYNYFMHHNLFDYLDLKQENINIPLGVNNYQEFANKYDQKIIDAGGIDLQILGLGINGHIGFNEPPCDFESKTRVVNLVKSTIKANSRFFKNINEVPKQAVSMGIKSIINAKKIILIAFGFNKAKAIKELVEGKISINWPCTVLRNHKDFTLVIDKEAKSLLDQKE